MNPGGTNIWVGKSVIPNVSALEACVGRVQLKKLKKIMEKRQWIVNKLREGVLGLNTASLWKIIAGVEPNNWFCFLHYDKEKISVEKERFAKAVQSERIPIGAHYVKVMYDRAWIMDRKTYGNSGCPWNCPVYRKNIDYTHCCPNAEKAIADHMIFMKVGQRGKWRIL